MNFFKSHLGLIKFLSIKNNKKNIVFYSESKHYRNYFLELIVKLKKNSNFNVIYVTSDLEDLDFIDDDLKPIFIGDSNLRTIFFNILNCDIIIMTLTNIGNYHLKKSKNCKNYIYIFHSLVSTQRGYEKEAFKNYDIIFTASEYQKNELLKAEQIYKFPRKKIFNIGYFYFENIFKKVKLDNTNPKNILFAPTWYRTAKNLFDDYSVSIIQILLDNGYSVTLRTHPETVKRSKETLKIINLKFQNNQNFQLNTNLKDTSHFEKSKLLITDDGGVGMEYPYIYRKPVIYINYVKKINNKFYQDLNIEPIEDKFKRKCGYEIDAVNIKFLKNKISEVDKTFNDKMKNIDEFYERYGLNHLEGSKKAFQIIDEIL